MLKVNSISITSLLVLFTFLLLGCGGNSSSNDSNESPSTPPTTVTPPTPIVTGIDKFPVAKNIVIRGVNLQGALRSQLHIGYTEQEIVERISNVVTTLGFNSVRIGGTSSFGNSYNEIHKGFGWSKFANDPLVNIVHGQIASYDDEPYNFNIMGLRVAAHANASIWLDLSTLVDDQEIELILSLIDDYGLEIAGITRDNEPYIPKRFENYQSAYAILDADKYRDAWWPAMYVIKGNQPAERKIREQAVAAEVIKYREADEGVELHIYYPKEADDMGIAPEQWITEALDESSRKLGTAKFMVGEWSGKDQETFSDEEVNTIIDSYLTVFEARDIPYYYQLLGSSNEKFGLWNFKTNEANRGASVFVQHHCGASCM